MNEHFEIESVSEFLMKDHVIILNDLMSFTRIIRSDTVEWSRWVHEVKFSANRHIYLEEKVVFMHCEMIELIEKDIMARIFTDHDIILRDLDFIECKNRYDQVMIKKLYFFFDKHVKYEELEFYPILDQNINERNKGKFIDFIKKDRNLGYFPIQQMREYAKIHPSELCKDQIDF
jgi:hypothetical protein